MNYKGSTDSRGVVFPDSPLKLKLRKKSGGHHQKWRQNSYFSNALSINSLGIRGAQSSLKAPPMRTRECEWILILKSTEKNRTIRSAFGTDEWEWPRNRRNVTLLLQGRRCVTAPGYRWMQRNCLITDETSGLRLRRAGWSAAEFPRGIGGTYECDRFAQPVTLCKISLSDSAEGRQEEKRGYQWPARFRRHCETSTIESWGSLRKGHRPGTTEVQISQPVERPWLSKELWSNSVCQSNTWGHLWCKASHDWGKSVLPVERCGVLFVIQIWI